jgi:hypothetical protein
MTNDQPSGMGLTQANPAADSTSAPQSKAPVWERARRKPWDHFVTLTFRESFSPRSAERHFETRFMPLIAVMAGRRVSTIGEVEAGSLNETVHIHVLLAGTAALSIGAISRAWGAGISDVEIYDPTLGGFNYVRKHWCDEETVKLIDDYRLRRRHRRPRRTPSRRNHSRERAMASHAR